MLPLLFLFSGPLVLELPFCSGPLTREGGCLAKLTTGHVCVCLWGWGEAQRPDILLGGAAGLGSGAS